ncbi:hypothetical protein BH11VER1_BH11VER1_09350 [soil metagenome]
MAILATLFGILAGLAGLASFVCFILVLIQMFKCAGAGMGIMGIITCGWGAFIWGWIKAKEYGLKKLMLGWTAAIVVMMLAYVGIAIFGVAAAASNPEFQDAFKKGMEEAQKKPVE